MKYKNETIDKLVYKSEMLKEKFWDDYYKEDSMANDLLDMSLRIIKTQNDLIDKYENIQFPILDISEISLATEVDKLTEETHEFINAIANNDEENMIEEALDVIQVLVNILHRYELTDKLEEGLKVHIEKLKSRGWNIENWL